MSRILVPQDRPFLTWLSLSVLMMFGTAGPADSQEAREVECPAAFAIGDTNKGVAMRDGAAGTSWIMYSSTPVASRFTPAPHPSNASNLIRVARRNGGWVFDNNVLTTAFVPQPDDCLVAVINHDERTASAITSPSKVFGIASGFLESDIALRLDRWGGRADQGELEVLGTYVRTSLNMPIDTVCPSQLPYGALGAGVAASDRAMGTGWLLWSEESVHDRFSPKPNRSNADHILAVQFDGSQWFFDNNKSLTPFKPRSTDCLISEVDFANDTASPLSTPGAKVGGVDSLSSLPKLIITPNLWRGNFNLGEFGLGEDQTGSVATECPTSLDIGNLNSGIAARDSAGGDGWILWSEQSLQSRFDPPPHPSNADHLISVKRSGTDWLYDNNSRLTPFVPSESDCIIATVNFSADTVTPTFGAAENIGGIDVVGFDPRLDYKGNTWNGVPNAGEFWVRTEQSVENLPNLTDYNQIFGDDFNQGSLDPELWATALLWGPYHRINNEQQFYVDTLGMHSGDYSAPKGYDPFVFTDETLKIVASPTSASLQPPEKPAVPDTRQPFPSEWRPYRWAEYRYAEEELNDDNSLKTPGYRPEEVDFLSGVISSYGSFKMTHGYVEMRAKVPAGKGLWPAFWLLNAHYVEDSPEIDVMEFLGDRVDTLYNTYHYFDISDGWRKISSPSFRNENSDWTADFHTFGLSWTPEKLIWYVDGVKTHEVNEGDLVPDPNNRYPGGTRYRVSGQAMYILANLAVGGNWPGEAPKSLGPKEFEIDYIRAYKKKIPRLAFNSQGALRPRDDFQLRFGDEFNAPLDPDKWNSSFIWGPYLIINDEQQYYVDSLASDADIGYTPFSVSNGKLTITAREIDYANDPWKPPTTKPNAEATENEPRDAVYDRYGYRDDGDYSRRTWTSGILTSYDAFKFAHGYAEARIKIPEGQGLWPAFWLLNGYYVAQQPEIDIMEARGREPERVYNTYHRKNDAGVDQPQDQKITTYGTQGVGYADGFHTFGVHWEHDRITWYIDGVQSHTYSKPDVGYQIMYVLLNLAVGGNFDSGYPRPDGSPPADMVVDYVRVYQIADPE